VITDFNTSQDTLVVVTPSTTATNAITLSTTGNDAIVLLDGVEYARIQGGASSFTTANVTLRDPVDFATMSDLADIDGNTSSAANLTSGADDFNGTDAAERANGLAGDDTLTGGGGNDTLAGDSGADILIGQEGDDQVFGAVGTDFVQGNAGADTLFGGAEDDWVSGGEDNDQLNGNAGADTVVGGSGVDNANGNNGDDLLVSGNLYASDLSEAQLNTLRTGGTLSGLAPGALDDGANDVLNGGAGNDTLVGSDADSLTGGEGNDVFAAYSDQDGTDAASVEDYDALADSLVVIYDNGTTAPAITVSTTGSVYTISADGEPVMVVASASAAISPGDIQLVERNADGSLTFP